MESQSITRSEASSAGFVATISGAFLVFAAWWVFTNVTPRMDEFQARLDISMQNPGRDLFATAFVVALALLLTAVAAFSSSMIKLFAFHRAKSQPTVSAASSN